MAAGKRALPWTVGLALSLLAACERAAPLGSTAPAEPEASAQSASVPLIVLMLNAPQTVAYAGERHFLANWSDNTGPQVLEYSEWVIADGSGQFTIDPLDVVLPLLTPGDEVEFLILQKLRERMMYRARDFAVRDLDAFTANYTLTDTGLAVVVAGVDCVRHRVEKRINPERRYTLDIDPTTGLTLCAREELLDGTLVTLSEFTTFTYTPSFAGVVWSQPINGEVPLTGTEAQIAKDLGFTPRTPKLLPDGWSQIGIAKLVDPLTKRVWARLTYSDGVEQIFFVVAENKRAKHQLKIPPGSGGQPNGNPDRVRKLAVGNWTLIEASLSRGEALVLGRAPDTVLYDLIQSAFF